MDEINFLFLKFVLSFINFKAFTLGYQTLLELINISLKWNSPKEKPFIKNLNLTIKNGNILCVFGKSGVGKSSLINIIAGIADDNLYFEGQIILNEKMLNDIPTEKRKIGLLLQDGALFPHLTVEQNIYFGMNKKIKSPYSFRRSKS